MEREHRLLETNVLAFLACLLVLSAPACDSSAADDTSTENVQIGDTSPGDSTSDTGTQSDPPAKEGIGAAVFDDSVVHQVSLTMTQADLDDLNDYSKLVSNASIIPQVVNRYFPATLEFDGVVLEEVAVRYKGDQSITACIDAKGKKQVKVMQEYGGMDICAKFSLKIDFNEYRSSNRLHGLKKLNLHAMAADPTKLHEVLGYGLFRSQDIPASRTAYVQLEINGVNQGLYLAVEQVDGRFTKDRFPGSGDGNLYKQVWPSKGKTKSDFVQALETNDDPGLMDVSDMLAFRDAVVKTQAGTFAADMAPFLDLDALARYIVVDRAIANFDGIFAWYGVKIGNTMLGAYNHNYYWYRDEISGRFVLIPWDLDKTFIYPEPIFWSKNKPWNKHGIVPNWNVVTGSCAGYTVNFDPGDLAIGGYGVQEMDCDKLLKLLRSAIWSQMAPLAKEFIEGPYAQQGMATAIARYRGLIETTVAKDTTIDVQHWQNAVDGLLDDLPLHRENLTLMMSELIEL